MDDTGNGDGEAATGGSPPMAASSLRSTKRGKLHTGTIRSLTPAQALEILQQAALNCRGAGIDIRVSEFFQPGGPSVVIVLANTALDGGNLVIASNTGNGGEPCRG